jgi:hypothetical protein
MEILRGFRWRELMIRIEYFSKNNQPRPNAALPARRGFVIAGVLSSLTFLLVLFSGRTRSSHS